ncbi:hypothetical protein FXF50_08085 [Micromonospora sp. AP08]|uniref:hypothetical protein n=1 Tax=Micromonospora sp. AP08 TaxID=2604467 RepID=UPI0011D73A03|nr:hypothetical protein [Micromonospora sp. AP08]TYB39197.1 hypothetical protein FXF50_08085 [Micromonospora sp. AP08]
MTARPPAVERAAPDPAGQPGTDDRMRALLSRPDPGPVAERLVLLHFQGRRTGRRFDVPVGLHRLGEDLVVATGSPWRHNFVGGAPAEVTWRGRRRPARLRLVTSAERTAHGYWRLLHRYGLTDGPRRLGVVVNVDRAPTLDEVRHAVDHSGLSLVEVELEEEGTE